VKHAPRQIDDFGISIIFETLCIVIFHRKRSIVQGGTAGVLAGLVALAFPIRSLGNSW
jgi:hypothetical protein